MKVTLQNQDLEVTIQYKGAELCSLKSTTTGREYLWQADPTHWAKQAPVLFPIVGTLKNNSFQYKGNSYSLPRHGFARDLDFMLLEQSDSKAIFQLCSSDQTRAVYPFEFDFRIEYQLFNNQLQTAYTIRNWGNEELYYNVGAHPAFAIPLEFSDYQLFFSADSELTAYALSADLISDTTRQILLHNHNLPLDYSLFEKDALVFKQLNSSAVTLLENGNPLLEVAFADFPNLGLWTKPQAPFICIEPWLGYADTVEASGVLQEKEGIQKLAAQASQTVQFTTTLFA